MPMDVSDLHVSQPLSTYSSAYAQEEDVFVAGGAVPTIQSANKSDTYYIQSRAMAYRNEATERAPGEESAGGNREYTTGTFTCKVNAFHEDIDDQLRANTDSVIDHDIEATKNATDKVLLKRETDFVTAFMSTSIWTGSTTGSDITVSPLWDTAGSAPIANIRAQQYSILVKGGKWPNRLGLSAQAWQALQDNSDFLARIGFGTPGAPSTVTLQLLAQLLELDEVWVMKSVANSAAEGATESLALTQVKDAWLYHAPTSAGLRTPTAGAMMNWTRYSPGGVRVKKFRLEQFESDRIEASAAYAFKVIDPKLGAFFSNVVA